MRKYLLDKEPWRWIEVEKDGNLCSRSKANFKLGAAWILTRCVQLYSRVV